MIATTHPLTLLPAPAAPSPSPSPLAPIDLALAAARNLPALWLATWKTGATRRRCSAALNDFTAFLCQVRLSPDKREKATETVMQQAELLCAD